MIDTSVLIVPEPSPESFRAHGWMVAVHNDYRLKGVSYTFWLWTHPLGVWVKGEGTCDFEALLAAVQAVRKLVLGLP